MPPSPQQASSGCWPWPCQYHRASAQSVQAGACWLYDDSGHRCVVLFCLLCGRLDGHAEPDDRVVVKCVSPGSALPRMFGPLPAQQHRGCGKLGGRVALLSLVPSSAAFLAFRAFALASASREEGELHSQPSSLSLSLHEKVQSLFYRKKVYVLIFKKKKKLKSVLG